jgi:hypothetical protein
MLLGSAVDACWSAGTIDVLTQIYTLDKGDTTKTRLTPSVADKALAIASQLLADPSYAEITAGESHVQEPLYATVKKRVGKRTLKLEICGLPDRFTIERDKSGKATGATVYDLKTARASDVDSDRSWYWACYKRQYFSQLAIYSALIQRTYGLRPHQVKARHVVCGTSEDDAGRYPYRLYKIPRTLLAGHWNAHLATATAIATTTDFRDPPATWEVLHAPGDLAAIEAADDEE